MKTLLVACVVVCLLVLAVSLETHSNSKKLLSLSKREAPVEKLDDEKSREKRGFWWRRRKSCRIIARCWRFWRRRRRLCRKKIRVVKGTPCPRYG